MARPYCGKPGAAGGVTSGRDNVRTFPGLSWSGSPRLFMVCVLERKSIHPRRSAFCGRMDVNIFQRLSPGLTM
jgi:hypothetical protein